MESDVSATSCLADKAKVDYALSGAVPTRRPWQLLRHPHSAWSTVGRLGRSHNGRAIRSGCCGVFLRFWKRPTMPGRRLTRRSLRTSWQLLRHPHSAWSTVGRLGRSHNGRAIRSGCFGVSLRFWKRPTMPGRRPTRRSLRTSWSARAHCSTGSRPGRCVPKELLPDQDTATPHQHSGFPPIYTLSPTARQRPAS